MKLIVASENLWSIDAVGKKEEERNRQQVIADERLRQHELNTLDNGILIHHHYHWHFHHLHQSHYVHSSNSSNDGCKEGIRFKRLTIRTKIEIEDKEIDR